MKRLYFLYAIIIHTSLFAAEINWANRWTHNPYPDSKTYLKNQSPNTPSPPPCSTLNDILNDIRFSLFNNNSNSYATSNRLYQKIAKYTEEEAASIQDDLDSLLHDFCNIKNHRSLPFTMQLVLVYLVRLTNNKVLEQINPLTGKALIHTLLTTFTEYIPPILFQKNINWFIETQCPHVNPGSNVLQLLFEKLINNPSMPSSTNTDLCIKTLLKLYPRMMLIQPDTQDTLFNKILHSDMQHQKKAEYLNLLLIAELKLTTDANQGNSLHA